jgi:tRNA modification GTPase
MHQELINENEFFISAKNDVNIQSLMDRLGLFAAAALRGQEPAMVTRERQRTLLEATLAGLTEALGQSEHELVAESLHRAADALGRLTGRIDVEDVLDVIFRDFCIGK